MNNEERKYPSMDMTYEWGRTAPEQLSKEASSLDTKIFSVLVAANVIIGVMVAFVKQVQFDVSLIPFGIAFVSFLIIFVKSLQAYRAQWFYVADSPEILEEDYWKLEPYQAKREYWEYVKKDFTQNFEATKAKGKTLLLVVPMLALEVIALIAWVFLTSCLIS
jgi:hypothetical protein